MSESTFASLQDPDPFERSAALDELSMTAAPEVVVEAAARLLADEDPGVREHAARLLTANASVDAAERIVPYIASGNITVRNLAGEVLIQMGEAAISALSPAVDDADKDVRKFAIDVLAELPAYDLIDQIAAHLDDEDGNVRLAVIDALGALHAVDYADEVRARYDRETLARPSIIEALGAFGRTDDLDLLERALSEDDPVVQFSAAEALATQEAPEVLDLLLRQVDAVNPMARSIVLDSIVNLCEAHPERAEALPERLQQHLLTMMDDPDLGYRCKAARGFRFFVNDETIQNLLSYAGEDDQLDVQIFETVSLHPAPFSQIACVTDGGTMDAAAGVNFTLGLLAQDAIPDARTADVGTFLETHFDALDADTKIAALGLCQRLAHPALHPVIHAGVADPDPVVNSFASDAAYDMGLNLVS